MTQWRGFGLSADEAALAQSRLRDLGSDLARSGGLRSPEWRAVFERTPRHLYVPAFYVRDGDDWRYVDSERSADRPEWLDQVYSNTTLITQLTTVTHPDGSKYLTYTSSSTLPGLMLRMLEELDVHDGHRVLEIGTGSGYNAALLSARLGDQNVSTIDIHPELTTTAGHRLADEGHHPTLVTGNGADGYSRNAPYDRVIATCSVRSIPQAWFDQVRLGGVILANLCDELSGVTAALTVTGPGQATGRFLPGYAGFMALRPDPGDQVLPARIGYPFWTVADGTDDRLSELNPALLDDPEFAFLAGLYLPDVHRQEISSTDGDTGLALFAQDGSRAETWHTPERGGYLVGQAGPTRLWDIIEKAYAFWAGHGRPHWSQFGITAGPTDQYVWFDQPGSPYRWHIDP